MVIIDASDFRPFAARSVLKDVAKKGSTDLSPSAAVIEIIEGIAKDDNDPMQKHATTLLEQRKVAKT